MQRLFRPLVSSVSPTSFAWLRTPGPQPSAPRGRERPPTPQQSVELPQQQFRRQRPDADLMLQSLSLQQFYDDEPGVLILAHCVDSTDVRMIQGLVDRAQDMRRRL